MRKLSLVLLLIGVALGAFLLGRTTSMPPTDRTQPRTATTARQSLAASATVAPRKHRPILRYFASVDQRNLPQEGVLGGTMVAGTIAFPKDFDRGSGQRFYVVGGDGHLLETWTYEVNNSGSWKHIETHEGYAPVDFEDHLEDYDVYLWRPAFYIPADATKEGLSPS